MLDWFKQHEALVWWLGIVSIVLFALGAAFAPHVVARLPADYFCRPRQAAPWANRHPMLRTGCVWAGTCLGRCWRWPGC